ncbi:MAG: hypothetical protein ACETVZ_09520 [Phycisphaerae bacterium]
MRRTFKRIARSTGYWPVIIFCMVFLVTIMSQPALTRQRSTDQIQTKPPRGYNRKIKIGEFPPDFELPRLNLKTDEAGKPIGVISQNDTIRLSSFRGKRPVCLIMSSYT